MPGYGHCVTRTCGAVPVAPDSVSGSPVRGRSEIRSRGGVAGISLSGISRGRFSAAPLGALGVDTHRVPCPEGGERHGPCRMRCGHSCLRPCALPPLRRAVTLPPSCFPSSASPRDVASRDVLTCAVRRRAGRGGVSRHHPLRHPEGPFMKPLTEHDIRTSFVNCSKGAAKRLPCPRTWRTSTTGTTWTSWAGPICPRPIAAISSSSAPPDSSACPCAPPPATAASCAAACARCA